MIFTVTGQKKMLQSHIELQLLGPELNYKMNGIEWFNMELKYSNNIMILKLTPNKKILVALNDITKNNIQKFWLRNI